MTKPVTVSVLSAIGLVLLAVVTIGMLPGGVELRVAEVNRDVPLVVLPLKPGERFTLHYFHSVEDAPIWEEHSVDQNGRIFIEEERYLKFGAGMGRMPGVGRMVMRGLYEAIVDMHQPTGDFVLRVGSTGVDHTLIWRHAHINLSAIVPHKAVQFSARPVSPYYRLWRRVWPHPATPEPDGS